MRKQIERGGFGRLFVSAVADMFSLGGPPRAYPSTSADEISRAAWDQTGKAMRDALKSQEASDRTRLCV